MAEKTSRRAFVGRCLAASAALWAHPLGRARAAAAERGRSGRATNAPEKDGLPCGKIGNLTISRLILGGNLFSGWAHARDLLYVSRLMEAYNTKAKTAETLKVAQQHGINTIMVHELQLGLLEAAKRQSGAAMQAMAYMDAMRSRKGFLAAIKRAIARGAVALTTSGDSTDRLVKAGRIEKVEEALDLIRDAGVPAGVGAHALETVLACEAASLEPDFYFKTFHHDRYWSAIPRESRRAWCWYEEGSGYENNMWCLEPEGTAEFMRTVKKPWIAFKVLAAGAIHPRSGFHYAFANGADFLAVGMFDFQIAEDVEIGTKILKGLKGRSRPWMG